MPLVLRLAYVNTSWTSINLHSDHLNHPLKAAADCHNSSAMTLRADNSAARHPGCRSCNLMSEGSGRRRGKDGNAEEEADIVKGESTDI